MKSANFKGYLVRFAAALALTTISYNPSGYSYVHWLVSDAGGSLPLQLLVGAVLLIGYGVFLAAGYKSMGVFGLLTVAALLLTLVWVLWSYGLLALYSSSAAIWLALLISAAVLAVGLYWAAIWKTLTGQVAVQDTHDLGVD